MKERKRGRKNTDRKTWRKERSGRKPETESFKLPQLFHGSLFTHLAMFRVPLSPALAPTHTSVEGGRLGERAPCSSLQQQEEAWPNQILYPANPSQEKQ